MTMVADGAGGLLGRGYIAIHGYTRPFNDAMRSASQEAQRGFSQLQKSALNMSGAIAGAFTMTAAATAALAFSIRSAAEAAAQYEDQWRRIHSVSQDSAEAVKELSDEATRLAAQLGVPHREALDALYRIVDVGYEGADAIDIFRISLAAAVGRQENLGDVTKAVTGMMHAWNVPVERSGELMDLMAAAARLGAGDISDLGEQMAATASLQLGPLNVGLMDLLAIVVPLSKTNLDFAGALRAVGSGMRRLLDAGTDVQRVFDELGVRTFAELVTMQDEAEDSQGRFLSALRQVTEVAEELHITIWEIVGSGQRQAAMLRVLTDETGEFEEAYKQLREAGGETFEILEKALERTSLATRAFGTEFSRLFVTIGELFTDIYGNMMASVAAFVRSLTDTIQESEELQAAIAAMITEALKIGGIITLVGMLVLLLKTLKSTVVMVMGAGLALILAWRYNILGVQEGFSALLGLIQSILAPIGRMISLLLGLQDVPPVINAVVGGFAVLLALKVKAWAIGVLGIFASIKATFLAISPVIWLAVGAVTALIYAFTELSFVGSAIIGILASLMAIQVITWITSIVTVFKSLVAIIASASASLMAMKAPLLAVNSAMLIIGGGTALLLHYFTDLPPVISAVTGVIAGLVAAKLAAAAATSVWVAAILLVVAALIWLKRVEEAIEEAIADAIPDEIVFPFGLERHVRPYIDPGVFRHLPDDAGPYQTGGFVPGFGRGDKVPALLEPGEFVWPRGLVQAHPEVIKGLWQGFQAGGPVAAGAATAAGAGNPNNELSQVADAASDAAGWLEDLGTTIANFLIPIAVALGAEEDQLRKDFRRIRTVIRGFESALRDMTDVSTILEETQREVIDNFFAQTDADRARRIEEQERAEIYRGLREAVLGFRDALFELLGLRPEIVAILDSIGELGRSIYEFRTAVARMTEDPEEVPSLLEAFDIFIEEIRALSDQYEEVRIASEAAVSAQERARQELEELGIETGIVQDLMDAYRQDALPGLIEETDRLAGIQEEAADLTRRAEEALQGAAELRALADRRAAEGAYEMAESLRNLAFSADERAVRALQDLGELRQPLRGLRVSVQEATENLEAIGDFERITADVAAGIGHALLGLPIDEAAEFGLQVADAASAAISLGRALIDLVNNILAWAESVYQEVMDKVRETFIGVRDAIERILSPFERKARELIYALQDLIVASEEWRAIMQGQVRLTNLLMSMLLGPLTLLGAILSYIIGSFEDLVDVVEDVTRETERRFRALNVPMGYATERLEYLVARPGVPYRPPVEEERPPDERDPLEEFPEWIRNLIAASEAIQTVISALERFYNTLTQIWETVGPAIMGALDESLLAFAGSLTSLRERIQAMIPLFEATLPPILKGIADILLNQIIAALTFFVALYEQVGNRLGKFGESLSRLAAQLPGLAEAFAQLAGPVLNTVLSGLTMLANFFSDTLLPEMSGWFKELGAWWKSEVDPFLRSEVFPVLQGWLEQVINFISKRIIPFITGPVWDLFQRVWPLVENFLWELLGIVEEIVNYLEDNWPEIRDAVLGNIKTFFDEILDDLRVGFGIWIAKNHDLWEGIGIIWESGSHSILEKLGITVYLIANALWEGIGPVGQFAVVVVGAIAAISAFVPGVWEAIAGIVSALAGGISGILNVLAPVVAVVGAVIIAFKMIQDAGQWLAMGLQLIVNFLVAIPNFIIMALNALISLINIIPGINIPTITPITPPTISFAEGGIVMDEVLGLVGDVGPEAIIPLNRLDEFMHEPGPEGLLVVEVPVNIDGREVARSVARVNIREQTRRGKR